MNLEEEIKALFDGLPEDFLCNQAVSDVIDQLEKDVLKLLQPLMAHLQPENRPGGYEYASTQNDILELWDEALKWFDELDKHLAGKVDVVCIKRKWLEELNCKKWFDENTGDIIKDMLHRKGYSSTETKHVLRYFIRKELLGKGDAPQKELKK